MCLLIVEYTVYIIVDIACSTTNSFRSLRLLQLRPPSEMRLDPTLPFCSAVPTLKLSDKNAALRLSKLVPSCSRDGLLGQMNQYANLLLQRVDSSVARTSFARGLCVNERKLYATVLRDWSLKCSRKKES